MHLIRYLYLSVAATLVAMAIAVSAQAGQPLKRVLSDVGISQSPSAVPWQQVELGDSSVSRRRPANCGRAHATRRPVAMVPGLKYDPRTMIPRGF